ncbi:5-methylthioadenosine/S-adenosylhomocysteine deaminase [Parabacteroides sp. PF5-5]|uniref:amidohydrolase n=1 Tax=unclassified Parabacteroides TaxID=2649774 RepID=UPI002473852C|nr:MULTISPECIES: amidohydrolase [unclassified Parabacteroides]MDH6303764.1 5-methylthioadenosine/S-adenosylhomocysteine deaminase [Parabacteroides sp. PH5-39]MDH6314381.1 5-methylthioadenosine/S-adenosylhomocysteine deaminase [Parabacteroides sp. PF5-13]MDH6318554.1 5-methylthioadenosine/S-adenosylhomocysteine deaminase [Parabacteroides sp. PH5-13]MDH6322153.1 5-methylthioadenosine/S-adenosylhomocysteine deaminase [Parabacteroides sp. PH5-8]MDH6325767.1 5-methylthioadenosine/S-adenosylhomocyst
MKTILIKGAELNGKARDILISGNHIKQIADYLPNDADTVIDAKKKAVIPGLVNMHAHAAMTLFRGFGDDMPLMPWLEEKIWPNEAKLTREDVYWGAKLACLEMIKSGTTAFFDMYHKFPATAMATEEMGIRATISSACFDHFQPEQAEKAKTHVHKLFDGMGNYGSRIKFALGPHAIYTVSGELLQWIDAFSAEHQVPIHLHLAETETEMRDSVSHFGHTPVRYLHQLGVLSPRLIIAHGLYVDEEEIQLLADHGVKVVHNPASNMKLASGIEFKFAEMRKAGVAVGIGTDGCSSSNNLDMVEAMKLASLLGKGWRKDPVVLTADEMLYAATEQGAAMMGLKAGRIEEGYLADLCLVDLRTPAFTPNFNFVSNLVYAANGSCIDTVICDGKILMQNKQVPGEDQILEKTAEIAYKLMER